MPHRAIFLDLNGTLVLPVQVQSLSEYAPIPGASEAIHLLNEQGFLCPVVTVQSRIAKGLYSLDDFQVWFTKFQTESKAQGATILGPYICPHRDSDNCACRKPQPFLYEQAAAEWDIDLTRSFVVGDTREDMLAARNLGSSSCLVRTGWCESSVTTFQADQVADYVAADIGEVAQWIIASQST